MEILRPDVTNSPRPIEILHFDNYDALINHRVDGDSQRVEQLLQQVHNGIPTTWIPLKEQPRKILPNIFVDNPAGPQFLAKKREITNDQDAKKAFATSKDAWRYDFPKRRLYAYNSLANEIHLAPRIKRILDLYEAKSIAANHGYIDIRYVEPLIGLINRQTGEKTMFYDFVDGDNFFHLVANKNWEDKNNEIEKINNFSFNIYQLFIQHEIHPEDLWPKQFIYPHNNQMGKPIYLIDTEGFYEEKHQPHY